MQEKTKTGWTETATAKLEWNRNRTAHAHNQYQQTNYYLLQRFVLTTTRGQTRKDAIIGELQFAKSRLPNQTNVPEKEYKELEELNTAVRASRFSHVCSNIVINKFFNWAQFLMSQQRVYQFTQVDRWNKSLKNDQSIWTAMQRKETNLSDKTRLIYFEKKMKGF